MFRIASGRLFFRRFLPCSALTWGRLNAVLQLLGDYPSCFRAPAYVIAPNDAGSVQEYDFRCRFDCISEAQPLPGQDGECQLELIMLLAGSVRVLARGQPKDVEPLRIGQAQ